MSTRNLRISWVISLLTTIFSLSFPAYAKYSGGTGEPNDPYLIYTAEQMNQIGQDPCDWDKHFKLMADIDLSEYSETTFNSIGTSSPLCPFTGIFNGNGFTISNFSYISTDANDIGLFGYIAGPNSQITDLGLIDPDIDAGTGDNIGSLVGWLGEGTIKNCYVVGCRISGNSNVGCLVGKNYGTWLISEGTIINCYATGIILGIQRLGGLCGGNSGTISECNATATLTVGDYSSSLGGLCGANNGTISQCYATSTVTGGDGSSWFGGLCGANGGNSIISNCYATGSVTGKNYSADLAGLCGVNWGTILNSYTTVSVTGGHNSGGIGGLCGGNLGTIYNCFWDNQTCGTNYSSGGWGMSTADMMIESTYIGWNNGVWIIDEGQDYPHLVWENTPGAIIDYEYPRNYPGNGKDQPFELDSPEDIVCLSLRLDDWDKNFVLTDDIDMTSVIDYRPVEIFTGSFDSKDHVIKNLTINSKVIGNNNKLGLFSEIGSGGQVADLSLLDVTVTGSDNSLYLGGLCGQNNGIINNCHTSATINGAQYLGGLCGDNQTGLISTCYATGSVIGASYLGGLSGSNSNIISNCSSNVNVSSGVGFSPALGGFCGYNFGTISDCYATGSVKGGMSSGGFCGENWGSISNCYATGIVTGGTMNFGGLVGENWSNVTASFWDIETSGQATSNGGVGKTTSEMQDPNMFMNAGWDFVGGLDGPHDIWTKPVNGGYPILCWQLSPPPSLPNFSGGTGRFDDSYLISTAGDLNSIGHNPRLMAAHFKLTADIDLAGIDFYIIGSEAYPFTGVFDGNGHTISNFSYISTDTDNIGLFGYVQGRNALIKDLGLIDPNINAGTGDTVGSLVGILDIGDRLGISGRKTVENCYAQGGSIMGEEDVGGLVGVNFCGLIFNSYSSVSVSGVLNVGGLVGENSSGTISNSYSLSSVSGGLYVGGLVGGNSHSTITNCYAEGSVMGDFFAGGLVGNNSVGSVTMSYSTGIVTGTGVYVGGLVGGSSGYVTQCFWDVQTSGQPTSVGGAGKTTVEMQTASTFFEAGWDFVDETENGTENIWWIDEGQDYPRLWWESLE